MKGGWLLFLGLLLPLVAAWVWHTRRSDSIQTTGTYALLGLSGVVVLLSSFLVLPWIQFADRPAVMQRVRDVAATAALAPVVENVPGVCALAKLRCPLSANLNEPFEEPDWRTTWKQIQDKPLATGWDLWLRVPIAGSGLRLGLLLSVVGSGLALVWCALVALGFDLGALDKVPAVTVGLVVLVAFALLLPRVPTLDTFGTNSELGALWLAYLAGARTGPGLWWAFLGQGFILAGICGMLFLSTGTEDPDSLDDPYD